MDIGRNWKLAEELNIFQIILLMADLDPTEFEGLSFEQWPLEVRKQTAPIKFAIQNAVIGEKIDSGIERYENSYESEINWNSTRIDVQSVTDWLNSKNYGSCFFTDGEIGLPGFADSFGNFYAPKLAAAVAAWTEVTSKAGLLNNKAPKKALEKWLREHASEFGLTKEDGNPNNQGIEEICKIANWKPEGGATPTSTRAGQETELPRVPTSGGRRLKGKPSPPSSQPTHGTPFSEDDIPF